VLTVYAVRPPVFTDDVVAVVRMLAEQAALVLRSHELLREAAQVKALVEMTRMKDDFLSVVAHDVRTPLTTILINAELIHKALSADDRNARRAASLHGEAVRLKQLVEDYLDVVRAERGSGQQPARRERQDLVDVVRTAISGLEDGQARVDLTAFGPVPTMVDSGRILQLVQNLVGNALKYSDASQRVQVHVGVEDDRALIRVTDRGIGVPDADLPFLFERFHRGSNTDDRRYRGLGLGLYICRQVAQEHGGDISVTSKVGEGTTFTVLLGPVSEPMPEAAPSNAFRPADGDEELGATLRGAAEANGEAGACWPSSRSWWSMTTRPSGTPCATCSRITASRSRRRSTAATRWTRWPPACRAWCSSTCGCRSWMAGTSRGRCARQASRRRWWS
jgi:K+-sensing histidine kinase KdpD